MNTHEIIHTQLEAAIASLSRARDRIANMEPDETREIGRQIESAAFYLEDIQYNWESLACSRTARHIFAKPTSEAL
ncbi:MAG: hypothetical protein AUK53_06810 [Betaproteobacteria bacterium CG2_30_59_46]|nr:MAG: hypothetical protein AUK53_06810 [Betaproteobacteria bacterium CG2_30_59_46]PIQ12933.1 MAG: hypothetical protein COW70_07275 [Hydrogenophilales bacterium CG18_big_fil_WC_8_21_14_2_50_58_12]PJB04875.1 MAG: hypothetical protein CO125_10540 [Hydrogenophilales bacterium CG_4_9_14_3_um_filter_59_35]